MRIPFLLAALALAAAPVAAQGILVSAGCERSCPAGPRPPALLPIGSVTVSATLRDTLARTYVNHVFRNAAGETLDANLFFPLPDDATLGHVVASSGVRTLRYDHASTEEASRRLLDSLARAHPGLRLPAYRGMRVVHVPVPAIPGAEVTVQIAYHQPLAMRGGVVHYHYPLAAASGRALIGQLRMVMDVRTLAGFDDLRVPSHPARIEWGTESGRCLPRERCGTRGFPSTRVKVVRVDGGRDLQSRDFQLQFTPSPVGPVSPVAWPR